jgi:hypothetical protein
MKAVLNETFRTEIFQLADLLDQQETTAFEQLNHRFNQPPSSAASTSSSSSHTGQKRNHSPGGSHSSHQMTGNHRETVVIKTNTGESKPTTAGGTRRRKQSAKQVESRPQSAVSDATSIESVSGSVAEEKVSPKVGQRRKTLDPSQKYGSSSSKVPSTPVTPTGKGSSDSLNGLFSSHSASAALTTLNKPSVNTTTPPSPTAAATSLTPTAGGLHSTNGLNGGSSSSTPLAVSSSSNNPLLIIKHASYQISKQKLFKKFELRKFHQSTQQDQHFVHSIRYEMVSFIFSLLIKEAMNNYMNKEYNLLENKLLTHYAKEMEDLNVLQAKELAALLNSKPHLQPSSLAPTQQLQQQHQHEEEKEYEENERQGQVRQQDLNRGEGGGGEKEEGGAVSASDGGGGGDESVEDHSTFISQGAKGVLLRQATSVAEVNPSSSSHQFHIPLDLETIGEDMSILRRHHEENKMKFENYLLERRRVKRKLFDDAKKLTFEKLSNKLQDIKVESENAMMSPGALGKYKTILRIINLMKNNGK